MPVPDSEILGRDGILRSRVVCREKRLHRLSH